MRKQNEWEKTGGNWEGENSNLSRVWIEEKWSLK